MNTSVYTWLYFRLIPCTTWSVKGDFLLVVLLINRVCFCLPCETLYHSHICGLKANGQEARQKSHC